MKWQTAWYFCSLWRPAKLLEEMVTTPSPSQAARAVQGALARVTISYENKGEEMLFWVSGEVMPRTKGGVRKAGLVRQRRKDWTFISLDSESMKVGFVIPMDPVSCPAPTRVTVMPCQSHLPSTLANPLPAPVQDRDALLPRGVVTASARPAFRPISPLWALPTSQVRRGYSPVRTLAVGTSCAKSSLHCRLCLEHLCWKTCRQGTKRSPFNIHCVLHELAEASHVLDRKLLSVATNEIQQSTHIECLSHAKRG